MNKLVFGSFSSQQLVLSLQRVGGDEAPVREHRRDGLPWGPSSLLSSLRVPSPSLVPPSESEARVPSVCRTNAVAFPCSSPVSPCFLVLFSLQDRDLPLCGAVNLSSHSTSKLVHGLLCTHAGTLRVSRSQVLRRTALSSLWTRMPSLSAWAIQYALQCVALTAQPSLLHLLLHLHSYNSGLGVCI